jgi:hypothetical protein
MGDVDKYSVYLLYWYKSTNADAAGNAEVADDMGDVDKYLNAEASVYENQMRFYTDGDWLD